MNEIPAVIRENGAALAVAAVLILAALIGPHLFHAHSANHVAERERQFQRDCVQGALSGNAPASCASFAAMRETYHFEPMNELIAARAKMIDTARRLSRGEIDSRDGYRQCVQDGSCADIPILSSRADPRSRESRATMAEFWHLVKGGDLTKGECDMMDVCRAFVALKLIPPPPALPGGLP